MSIVKSFNIFLDSNKVKSGSTGDNIQFNLARNGINCEDGEQIRLNLQHFNMYRNWYNVNKYNSNLTLTNTSSAATVEVNHFTIPETNYSTVGDLVNALATALLTALKESDDTKNPVINSKLPSTVDGNSNKMIEIIIGSPNHGLTAGELKLTVDISNDGFADDTGELLGVPGSFIVTIVDDSKIKFAAHFPAQTSTEQYVYIKTDLGNQNLESSTLSNIKGGNHHSEDIVHSNILGKATIANDFVNYDSGNSQEYYIDLSVKHLASFRLFLTDSKNRDLPKKSNQNADLGNKKFTAVIRIDVIKRFEPQKLQTKLPESNLPGTFLSKVNMPLKQ